MVELRYDPIANRATLTIDPRASVVGRVEVEQFEPGEAWGMTLCLDADGELARIEFADARRRLSARLLEQLDGPGWDRDPRGPGGVGGPQGPSYLTLDAAAGSVPRTLCADEGLARDVMLDLDAGGLLVGIEFY